MAEWFEKFFDGLYAQVLPNAFSAETTLAQAKAVRRMLRLRRGERVLDIPCGTGRLTLPLAGMGMAMTGVDLTAAYLRRARRDAAKAGAEVRYIRSDMRCIEFDREFDAAFNWFGSFGYFSDEDNLAFVRRVYRALKPGGRFLVEGPNRSFVLAHWRPRIDHDVHGVHMDIRNRFRAGRVESHWTMSRGDVREEHRFRMWLFNGADIRKLLTTAGFRGVRLYGMAPVQPLTRHSRRIVAVGRRPRE